MKKIYRIAEEERIMFELPEGARMIEETLRKYIENEVVPKVDAMEDGEVSTFDVAKKLFQTLGITEMIKARKGLRLSLAGGFLE